DEVQRVRQSIHRRINRVLNAHGLLSSLGSDPSPTNKTPYCLSCKPHPCNPESP
ncbi:MAG: hypothetical protein ACI9F9_000085, partial [Candidatus Paceibacteria bacterium]